MCSRLFRPDLLGGRGLERRLLVGSGIVSFGFYRTDVGGLDRRRGVHGGDIPSCVFQGGCLFFSAGLEGYASRGRG